MPTFPIFVVDAFSSGSFTGNQAAVCLVSRESPKYDEQVKVADEMRHSETAFIQLVNDGDSYTGSSEFNLRWFTPKTEVPLCGHATLASAAVLFKCINNQSECIKFNTFSGQLTARMESRDSDVISLDFPLNPPSKIQLDEAIKGITQVTIGNLAIADLQFSPNTKKLLIRLEDSKFPSSLLGSISPDFKKLLEYRSDVKGVIVTVRRPDDDDGGPDDDGDDEYGDDNDVDFYSRYFAPWVGIDEDPVTGSAHTVLGPYWSTIYGKKSLKAKQCSERTGILWVTVHEESGRCEIRGKSFVCLRGEFTF